MNQRLFIVLFILLGLCIQNAFAQVWENTANTNPNLSEPNIKTFSESDFQTLPTSVWLHEYTNVVVINIANEGSDKQTLRLYVNGQLTLLTKISSGREKFEAGCKPGQEPKKDHCSAHPYWSTTPVGYFDTDSLNEKYFSNLWQTWMPWAVFFESGIATHQAPAGTENRLGERASGGCVRMHPDKAPIVFKAVQSAGQGLVPSFNRDGSISKTKSGDVIRKISYKTLYIVQNVVKP
ncbi:MAG: L,D-transpeptidase [Pseudobdellovibrio sp.]